MVDVGQSFSYMFIKCQKKIRIQNESRWLNRVRSMGLKYLKRFNQVKLSGICSRYDPGTRTKACANGAIKAFPQIDNLPVCRLCRGGSHF